PVGLAVADPGRVPVVVANPVAPVPREQEVRLGFRPLRSVVQAVVVRPQEPGNRPSFLVPLGLGENAQPTAAGLVSPLCGPGGQAEPLPVRSVEQRDKLRQVGHASLLGWLAPSSTTGSPICLAAWSVLRLHCTGASGPRWPDPMGYGVIGSPTGSGPVSLGSSPGTPAVLLVARMPSGIRARGIPARPCAVWRDSARYANVGARLGREPRSAFCTGLARGRHRCAGSRGTWPRRLAAQDAALSRR